MTEIKALTHADVMHPEWAGCPICNALHRDISNARARGKYLFSIGALMDAEAESRAAYEARKQSAAEDYQL